MNTPPLINQAQQRKDNDQLKLLAVFHFVVGGLALFGIGFLFLHYFIMNTVFSRPELWKNHQGNFPPKEFLSIFVWFYFFMGVIMLVTCLVNILSGVFLLKKKHHLFSLIVAGLNCLQIPFGTALGVCTFIVLQRDSVRQSYET